MLAIRGWLKLVGPLPGDEATARRFPTPRTPEHLEEVAAFFGAVGTPLVALMTVAAAAWVVDRRAGRRAAIGVVAAAGSAAFNTLLKILWGPTPLWDRITEAPDANYPSGHVTYATALFGYLAFLGLERRRTEAAIVCLVIVLGMGPSRILDGSHLPSDVLAGYLLGAAWAIGVVLWVTRPAREPATMPARR